MPSSDIYGHKACTQYIDIDAEKHSSHKINKTGLKGNQLLLKNISEASRDSTVM
jgi:hypothetical protein